MNTYLISYKMIINKAVQNSCEELKNERLYKQLTTRVK